MSDVTQNRITRRQWIEHGKALAHLAGAIARGECSDASILSPMGMRVAFRSLDEFKRYVEFVSKKAGRFIKCT